MYLSYKHINMIFFSGDETSKTGSGTNKPIPRSRCLSRTKPFFAPREPLFGAREPLFGTPQTLFGTSKPLVEPPVLLFGTDKPLFGPPDSVLDRSESLSGSRQIGFDFDQTEKEISQSQFGEAPKQIGFTLGFLFGAGSRAQLPTSPLNKSLATKRTLSTNQNSSTESACSKIAKTNYKEQDEQKEEKIINTK